MISPSHVRRGMGKNISFRTYTRNEQTERRKSMDINKLIPIIAIVSVLVMFIWGTLAGTYQHSWLAVFAGGCAIAILSILNKKQDK